MHATISRELESLFSIHKHFRLGGKGKCSSKTHEERQRVIRMAFSQLKEGGIYLHTVGSFREKHARHLLERWAREGLSASTLATRHSILVALSEWIGKKGMIQPITAYLPRGRVARTAVAVHDKSWAANDVSFGQVLTLAHALDERLALYLELQHHFGLRVKESIELRPRRALSEDGRFLDVFEGTKGGRHRTVEIQNEDQRRVMQLALKLAEGTPQGRIRWPTMSFKQAQRRFYYLLETVGVTRQALGVTAHGLRHGFAQRKYLEVTGHEPPLRGGDWNAIGIARNTFGNEMVARSLGHGRPGIAATYYGSHGHAMRGQTPDWTGVVPLPDINASNAILSDGDGSPTDEREGDQ